MTHPLFRQDVFVETAFEKRFQAMLRSAWHKRNWHVIVADPGSGKTMGIRDMVKTAGSPAILAVTSPKNNDDEQALGDQLFGALGVPSRGHWSTRKPKLMGHLHHYGTQCLIVDDAQDLSLQHLMFIKELTDQGRLQYDHPPGLCLVAAGRGDTIPLKETLDLPDIMWLQFRRRMDKLEPFCRIAGHTSEEVRDILAALETVYGELFPQLNLHQWSGVIYTWLTQPSLDPTRSGRVTMDYLMKLVTTALEWSYEAGDASVLAETLEKAAELLVLRRNTLRLIDGTGPRIEVYPKDIAEQGSEPQAETGEAPALDPPKQRLPHRDEVRDANGSAIRKLFFLRTDSTRSGSLAGIDGGSRAMPVVWLCKQGEGKGTICGNCAASPAQVAASAQCHTLDRAGIGVGTCSEKGYKMSYDNRFQCEGLKNAPLSNLMNTLITRE